MLFKQKINPMAKKILLNISQEDIEVARYDINNSKDRLNPYRECCPISQCITNVLGYAYTGAIQTTINLDGKEIVFALNSQLRQLVKDFDASHGTLVAPTKGYAIVDDEDYDLLWKFFDYYNLHNNRSVVL